MALFSVRANVVSAAIASSGQHRGTSIVVVSDATALPERADQSTWPVIEPAEEGRLKVVRGPHNVIRRVLEFACEHPDVAVYLGSPTEIVATMYKEARATLGAADLLFCDEPGRLPVWQRTSIAADAAELVAISASIGLTISERTAHRILGAELGPLESVLAMIADDSAEEETAAPAPDIYRDRRGLKLHHTDVAEFQRELTKAFDILAERYYVHLKREPKVVVGREEVRVRFQFEKED
jgi:hypothetical protein